MKDVTCVSQAEIVGKYTFFIGNSDALLSLQPKILAKKFSNSLATA